MRRPVAWGAAAGGLAFAALFFSEGSSQSRVFWIGAPAVLVAAVGWAWRPPRLPLRGAIFFLSLAAFVVWQGVSIAWSIEPSRSWDYTNRGLVYFAFAAVGALVAGTPLLRFAWAGCLLLGALFVWALAAKVIPGLYPDYERLARLRYPIEYWNELALLAAASVPLGLWAVGPRQGCQRRDADRCVHPRGGECRSRHDPARFGLDFAGDRLGRRRVDVPGVDLAGHRADECTRHRRACDA
jgi:hypothetical protein